MYIWKTSPVAERPCFSQELGLNASLAMWSLFSYLLIIAILLFHFSITISITTFSQATFWTLIPRNGSAFAHPNIVLLLALLPTPTGSPWPHWDLQPTDTSVFLLIISPACVCPPCGLFHVFFFSLFLPRIFVAFLYPLSSVL